MAADLGTDIACAEDLTPELALATGIDGFLDDLTWRLRTQHGGLWYDQDYGTDLTQFVHSHGQNLHAVESAAEQELSKDERVSSVSASATLNRELSRIELTVTGTTLTGPFRLVVAVTELTVERLEEAA